ncbi:hypothetical protein NQ318_012444 [Aromia moschata]|uniref:MADF domain-containing protein n=1 Tax=Aromia moschata TaxID=1265417 RepID=A0AAV8XXX9_9CUCU|nr:hypothetical protein NQ318_012444 [Aromia moschata]
MATCRIYVNALAHFWENLSSCIVVFLVYGKLKVRSIVTGIRKNQAYEILIEKFKEIDASANKETVTKKINSLRTVYKKEVAKVIASTKSGTGEDDIYKPSLWYFDKLEFLNDPEKVRPSTSTIDDETSQDTGQERESFDGESDVDLPTAPSTPAPSTSSNLTESVNLNTTYSRTPNRKRKVPRAEDKTDAVMMKIGEKLQSLQEDSFDRFGKHVADRLRAVAGDQVKFAMKLIGDVLFEAEMVSLNRNCKIDIVGENRLQLFQRPQNIIAENTQQQQQQQHRSQINKEKRQQHNSNIGSYNSYMQTSQQSNQQRPYSLLEIGQHPHTPICPSEYENSDSSCSYLSQYVTNFDPDNSAT